MKSPMIKEKILNILNNSKLIIIISFIINIFLLLFSFNLMTSNHQYTFDGGDDYIKITDGLISISNDVNLIYGNNIEYVSEKDYEITELKIGYFLIRDNKNMKELFVENYNFGQESIMLSDFINNFTNFNLIEKNNAESLFTSNNVKLLDNGLYFVLEAKTIDGENINNRIELNLIKFSKF